MTKEQATIEYFNLVRDALGNPRAEGEVHHIVPRSCGGLDCDTNLVRLTYEEHFKAHELLPFIYDKGREHMAMVHARWMMSHTRGLEVNPDEYAQLKQCLSESMRGRIVSDETRQRLSESHIGLPSPRKGTHVSEETRAKLKKHSPWNKGRHLSESDKQRKRASALNHVTPQFRQRMREIALKRVTNGTHNFLKRNRSTAARPTCATITAANC